MLVSTLGKSFYCERAKFHFWLHLLGGLISPSWPSQHSKLGEY